MGSSGFDIDTVPKSDRVKPPCCCLRCFLEFSCSSLRFKAPLPGFPGMPKLLLRCETKIKVLIKSKKDLMSPN